MGVYGGLGRNYYIFSYHTSTAWSDDVGDDYDIDNQYVDNYGDDYNDQYDCHDHASRYTTNW